MLLSRIRAIALRNAPLRGSAPLSTRATKILSALDIPTNGKEVHGVYDGTWGGSGEPLVSVCPSTGETLAKITTATPAETQQAIDRAHDAYVSIRNMPAPRRGELIRQIRVALAEKRNDLGALVSLEMGKIRTEGEGEVQEFVDICDYAVGLSRMMNGRVVASERPGHSILEVPNPLGVVGVLSAFNFPVAVYGWNLSLSLAAEWCARRRSRTCLWGKDVGEAVVGSPSVHMVSFTGSEAVGKVVGKAVQDRFGKVLLELGGNNASVIMPDADLALAIPAVLFGAVGTAGQRCTSTRRLYVHRSIAPEFWIDYSEPMPALPTSLILTGGQKHSVGGDLQGGNWRCGPRDVCSRPERCHLDEIEQAIEWNNAVPQGLSSSLWTRDMRSLGKWIGPSGSDAGIVNVNVGTSGAEIGAAFGGNKSTGWGRESGGDAWKQYVRWSACTLNFSDEAPLAQGVNFDLK
ncbi:aldehyde dehydrogenase family [Rhizoctonia solani]|uniref:aldehyde dehydrogenase (NAD(+)) n=1 Tax=Rhizoctonia solani TaxID=456999 RepID=A0A8H7I7W0_9AGAM|nr:aldehyde dehydrogenase family [Rhizoctonia solani]